ncbi:alpha/beta hydrolase [Alteraurantiacibacter aestuarii]|uniref:lipase family alpha/beta hydrolase n=1 Tax=Alteraurantiacibacter aestuarii TaxID=650004 RepID=UPI0031D9D3E3
MAAGSPPPLFNALREGLAMQGLAASALRPPIRVRNAGHGEPVIVIPGMMSGDNSTSFLRRSLQASGFDARPSGLIFNTGATPQRLNDLQRRIEALHAERGQPVALVGWSLGGLFARVLGQRCAGDISCIITLGSPFSGDPHANHAWRLYELLNGHKVTQSPFPEDFRIKPPVRTIAIWSPNDGVVAPESARGLPDQSDEQVQVDATHMEMATAPQCVTRIIQLLGEGAG